MCTTLFYYTCVYIYSLLNSCGYWTLNKYYYYYYYLLSKVRLKSKLNIACSSWQSVIELCEIRDGLSSCEALSNDDVCKLIQL